MVGMDARATAEAATHGNTVSTAAIIVFLGQTRRQADGDRREVYTRATRPASSGTRGNDAYKLASAPYSRLLACFTSGQLTHTLARAPQLVSRRRPSLNPLRDARSLAAPPARRPSS